MATNRFYKYPLKFKLPLQIMSFLLGFFVPVVFLFLAVLSLFESLGWITLLNIETDGVGVIMALVIGVPFFFFIALSNLSLFPEIEVENNKFRLITPISKSNWIELEKIQSVGDATIGGIKRWGKLKVVQTDELPFIYGIFSSIYHFEHPGFFIHPKIQNFEEFISIFGK